MCDWCQWSIGASAVDRATKATAIAPTTSLVQCTPSHTRHQATSAITAQASVVSAHQIDRRLTYSPAITGTKPHVAAAANTWPLGEEKPVPGTSRAP